MGDELDEESEESDAEELRQMESERTKEGNCIIESRHEAEKQKVETRSVSVKHEKKQKNSLSLCLEQNEHDEETDGDEKGRVIEEGKAMEEDEKAKQEKTEGAEAELEEEGDANSADEQSSTGASVVSNLERIRRENILRNKQTMDLLLPVGSLMDQIKPRQARPVRRKRQSYELQSSRKSSRLHKSEQDSESEKGNFSWPALLKAKFVVPGIGVFSLYPGCIARDGKPNKPSSNSSNIDRVFLASVDEEGKLFLYKQNLAKLKSEDKFATPKALADFCYGRGRVEGDGFQLIYYKGKSLEEWRTILKTPGPAT